MRLKLQKLHALQHLLLLSRQPFLCFEVPLLKQIHGSVYLLNSCFCLSNFSLPSLLYLCFKAAVYGRDPNWGRIACAAGYATIPFNLNKLQISLGDIMLMNGGQPLPFDRYGLFFFFSSFTVRAAERDLHCFLLPFNYIEIFTCLVQLSIIVEIATSPNSKVIETLGFLAKMFEPETQNHSSPGI